MSLTIKAGDNIRFSGYSNGETDEDNPEVFEGIISHVTRTNRFGPYVTLNDGREAYLSDYDELAIVSVNPGARPELLEELAAVIGENSALSPAALAYVLVSKGFHR
ncbi:hypothetical protein [Leifsonia sp. Leaf264]|uniref:hypothetical protein n=1 Tax=Leifsonia sp. Leaf264 TaxID=1736314 RepID=UPI0006F26BEA|nr:hypothetical protein [Leifsonia sp. Leaf264]KQO98460.1 hypothetical protein ASF30_10385 [Leifsonia sp. Leaf264]